MNGRFSAVGACAVLGLSGAAYLLGRMEETRFLHWKDVLEALSYAVILLGVPLGLFEYSRAVKKEQQDREYGTYNALDEKYLAFQQLCLKHPRLNIFDLADEQPAVLTADEKKEELIAFTMLFSIFERAYLMYSDQSNAIKKKQWTGWDRYIRDYCSRANFQQAWKATGGTYDRDFERYMSSRLRAA